MRAFFVALMLLGSLFAAPALAQQAPPGRVGRVGLVAGTLAFHMAGEKGWSSAAVNYPVATGGSFWTPPEARAGMELGPDTLYLESSTELDVANLDQEVIRFGVPRGRIHFHIRQMEEERVEIDLPSGEVWLLAPGEYDIAAGTETAPAQVAVFSGRARFIGTGVDIAIEAGQTVQIGGSPFTYAFMPAAPDAFVAWCRAHDYEASRLASSHYVSPQMTGYDALDQYGVWIANPDYGEVWFPYAVAADWVPYSDGRWVWVAPWGWTWIDEEPWGFAPFHYGRWAFIGGRWGWVPGFYAPYPLYAPALVVFLTAGLPIGGAFGEGPIGWFPLGPGEVYWPSYTTNVIYIRNINRTVVRNIATLRVGRHGAPPQSAFRRALANRRFATVVTRRDFAEARSIRRVRLKVAAASLLRAKADPRPPRVTAHPAPLPPTVAPPPAPRRVRAVAHPPAAPRAPAAPHAPPAAAAAPRPTPVPPHPPAAAFRPPTAPPHPPAAAEHRPPAPHPPAAAAHPPAPPHPPAAAEHRPPVQVFHGPPAPHPPAAAEHRPAPPHPPAVAFHPPTPAPRPPAPAPHPPAAAHPPAPAHPPAKPEKKDQSQ